MLYVLKFTKEQVCLLLAFDGLTNNGFIRIFHGGYVPCSYTFTSFIFKIKNYFNISVIPINFGIVHY